MKRGKNNHIYVHIDADAFFASVEQVLHRELQEKAIVVGQNGGIVSALSYPAKKIGVPRVMPIVTVRKKYPQVTIVSSDFFAYGIFSDRLGRIIKEHLPDLVKNSVDECSSQIGLWVDDFQEAENLVKKIQYELFIKLGCSFSFGIAHTPLLAKLASGMNKPRGITILDSSNTASLIYDLPLSRISGIGNKTSKELARYQIRTIGEFVSAPRDWLLFKFSIVLPAIQEQILGKVNSIPKQKIAIKSMSRERTFPGTQKYDYLYSQMSLNIEYLSKRLRRENLFTKRIGVKIRDRNMNDIQEVISLSHPTRNPQEILSQATPLLKKIYSQNVHYRQVSVSLFGLCEQNIQNDLFGEQDKSQSDDKILSLIDKLESQFGTSCISLATSIYAQDTLCKLQSHHQEGDIYPHDLLPGESVKKRLAYPFLGYIK